MTDAIVQDGPTAWVWRMMETVLGASFPLSCRDALNRMEAAFRRFDRDGDGVVSERDMETLLRERMVDSVVWHIRRQYGREPNGDEPMPSLEPACRRLLPKELRSDRLLDNYIDLIDPSALDTQGQQAQALVWKACEDLDLSLADSARNQLASRRARLCDQWQGVGFSPDMNIDADTYRHLSGDLVNAIDRNGDGVITEADAKAFINRRASAELERLSATIHQRVQRAAETKRAECGISIPSGDKLYFISLGRGQSATLLKFSQKQEVDTAVVDVYIEPGKGSLSLAIRVNHPTIIRVTGETDRVADVTIFSNVCNDGMGQSDAAMSGLPGTKVTFAKGDCSGINFPHITDIKPDTLDPLERLFGRPFENYVGSGEAFCRVTVPPLRYKNARLEPRLVISPSRQSEPFWEAFWWRHPGGAIDVDPTLLVSSKPLLPRAQFDNDGGLAMLLDSGAITVVPDQLNPFARKQLDGTIYYPAFAVHREIEIPGSVLDQLVGKNMRTPIFLIGPDVPWPSLSASDRAKWSSMGEIYRTQIIRIPTGEFYPGPA